MNTRKVLHNFCKLLFLFGAEEFWYEPNKYENKLYWMYNKIIFLAMDILTVLELLVVILKGFPENYVNEARMFSITHVLMTIKRYNIRQNKLLARQVNQDMVKACIELEDEELYGKQYGKIKLFFIVYVGSVMLTLFLYIANGLHNMIVDGEPFLTVVSYWPAYTDKSITAAVVRVFNVLILSEMLGIMVAADSIVLSHLVMLGYKYRTLRKYFENLRDKIEVEKENDLETAEYLRSGCRDGIIMHQDLLNLFNNIQDAFGVSMSIQVCLCSGSAVLLLMQFALSGRINIGNVSITCFFLCTLFIMLGVVLWNAGDMTYEASLLSNAIFQCGWNLGAMQKPYHRDVRQLVLFACAQAQRPLVMKAFGVSDLSYATFVAVVKTTYSVFAVVYNGTN